MVHQDVDSISTERRLFGLLTTPQCLEECLRRGLLLAAHQAPGVLKHIVLHGIEKDLDFVETGKLLAQLVDQGLRGKTTDLQIELAQPLAGCALPAGKLTLGSSAASP